MKRENLWSVFWAGILAFCMGFGGVACMVTGLGLPVQWNWLAAGCAVAAMLAAICFSIRWGWVFFGGIGVLMLLGSRFWVQLKALCHSVMTFYNLGYGISIPQWMEGEAADSQILPLLFIAGAVMAAVVWTVLHQKRSFLAVGAALLPLASCLVVTNTVPAPFSIFLLLFGLVLLMLTQTVRRQDGAQANRLTAIVLLPTAAALVLLFYMVPQGNYNAPATMDNLLEWILDRLPFVDRSAEGEFVFAFGGESPEQVELDKAGNRDLADTPVMEVITDRAGTLYLRGRDYDVYDGLTWTATEDRVEEDFSPDDKWISGTTYELSVKLLQRRGQFYVPYYPTKSLIFRGGMAPSGEFRTEYSYEYRLLWDNWERQWQIDSSTEDSADAASVDARYLALPEEARERATVILTWILMDSKPTGDPELAQAIGEYVRNSAEYDLQTDRMPKSETDFAMWFLEDSETGYCVHFASAAAVLLRAAGIPARYVEGYTVNVQANETAIVRERMAHAWVEYYVDELGWVILEATPGDGEAPEETTGPAEQTTEPTQPATTAPTESTTDPLDSTEPEPPQSGEHTASTGDTAGSTDISQGKAPSGWFMAAVWVLAVLAVVAALVIGQWVIRRHQKLRRMYQGKANAQALARFLEARQLARLQKVPLPEELTELAQKARFSSHVLTKEELARFDTFLKESIEALCKKGWYWRLILRFVFAAR